ncbi:biopolymer transporter Tol [Aquiflexum sp.]|uniref:biopolymer transporter Tol n=1 Tax=Aquiflexum sp. TaxID=1872584 RepID=UPI0035939089
MKNRIIVLGLSIFFLQMPFLTWAQFDRERFGKNRVQHKNIEWYFYSSNNFEVYYNDGGGNNARMAIDYLESEFDRLTQLIGYVAYTKPKIFIYNSQQEILQSNLNLNKDEFTIDGQTFFSRLIGEVAFTGTWESFKRELIYTTSKVIIEEMLYGSTIADAFQSNLINSFPEWYIEGAAMYLAHGWSMEMDDFVRHHFKENKNIKLHKLKNREAGLVGQSVWNFIVEKYGRRYISSILNLSRINRNEENSIANTIGLNYKTFQEQWRQFYLNTNQQVFTSFKEINDSNEIASTSSSHLGIINDIKFSPDAKHLAYVINNGGRFKVQVKELANGRERTIYSGGANSSDQPVNLSAPIIAWRDTLNLAIATFKRGTTTLRSRAIDGSAQDKIFLRNITQILSLDFNSSGRNMVLSAISNGKSDIYALNVRGVGKRITNDVFDNISPVFLNDSTIIFASNQVVLADSLLTKTPDVKLLPDYFNLFQVDMEDSAKITKLTNLNNRNIRPRVLNSNNVLFLSDQSGIMNLMRLTISNGIASQMSAFNKSLEAFDYSSRANRIAYSYRDGNQSRLVLESYSNVDQFTPSTPRIQLSQAKTLSERISSRRVEIEEEQRPAQTEIVRRPVQTQAKRDTTLNIRLEDLLLSPPPRGTTPQATAATPPTTTTSTQPPVSDRVLRTDTEIEFDTIPAPKSLTGSISTDRLRFERKGGIDTDNYTFDTIPRIAAPESRPVQAGGRSNILENFRRQSLQKRVTGPRRMMPQFITSSLSTDWIVDPLRGFGLALSGNMTDILDNHNFKGGLMTPLDFRSGSDIFFEYEYLKQRIDFRLRYDRTALQIPQGDVFQRYVLNKTEFGFSYPFNIHSRVSISPFIAKTQYFNLNPDSIVRGQMPERNRLDVNYAGGRFEFVYDNTQQIGLYMQKGLKAKTGIVHYQGLNIAERSFTNFYLDFRNYQSIHKNIILASRLYVGSFFGNNPQNYLVGGMNNWLFNQFYNPPSNRPEESPVRNPEGMENSNILFAEFVDLRGYLFDEIRGRNVMTFTTELRIPVFSYLSRGNITSNFVKNFQLVAFYDVGSAWNTAAPWEKVNDQNTEVISTPGSPFVITLNNFNNPWLQSFGGGMRTVLLNYYFKFDVAKPVRNYQGDDLKFYVTLGYNF